MVNNSISRAEAAILYLTFGLLIFGIVMSQLDRFWFEYSYVVEDGFIEWMTVLSILCMLTIGIIRLTKLYRFRPPLFLISLVVFVLLCFFVAGEEISWGQRMMEAKSPRFFAKYNAQKETNIHNLIIDGKSVNLIVFSRLMILGMVIYLLIFPVLYARKMNIRNWADRAGIPVPRVYQVVSLLLIFGLISLCPSGKRSELLEFGTCYIFLAIVLYPKNAQIFKLP